MDPSWDMHQLMVSQDGPHGARGEGLHGTVGAALAPLLAMRRMMAMMVATSCIDGKTSPLKFYDVQCFIGIPIVTNWCKFLSEGMDNYNVFFSGKSSKK